MIQHIAPRIRMVIVLVCAFFISGIIMNYSHSNSVGETVTHAPSIQVTNMVGDFSHSVANSGSSILASLQSIKIPTLINIVPQEEISPSPAIEPTVNQEWITGTQETPGVPTSTPAMLLPTEDISAPTDETTASPDEPTDVPKAKSTPKPTKPPKPTAKPQPTATPAPKPVTSDQRPGSNFDDVVNKVSQIMCIPAALMKATQAEETGSRYLSFAKDKFSLANRYNWWNDPSVTTYDYWVASAFFGQSGKAPPDSKFPGQEIGTPLQPGAYDQMIMGPLAISQQEQDVSRKDTIKILPKNIDRRVLFDNLVIYADITINRAGKSPRPSCSDWPEETVRIVAEKHFGACDAGNGKNYCNDIWNFYKSFK